MNAWYKQLVNTIKTRFKSHKNQIDKWDNRFLVMAQLVSTWSKDPSTKCGAVIVRPDKSVCSVGFNGFPQQMSDDDSLYLDRYEKYSRVIHSEMNAIQFAQDSSLRGYTTYCYPFLPCDRCCVHLMQKGIVRIVAPTATPDLVSRWKDSIERVRSYNSSSFRVEEVEWM